MSEIATTDRPMSFIEEDIKELGLYEEYLRQKSKSPVTSKGSTHEVDMSAEGLSSQSADRMAEYIIDRSSTGMRPKPVTEQPKVLSNSDEVNMKCRDEDPELFFPLGETKPADVEKIRRAKAICLGCEALEACGAQALEEKEESGIWGGMTPNERRKILRERQKAARS